MRELLILRHAKSDWAADYQADHERPLNSRGLQAASLMGRFLHDAGALPDRVIASSAVRAHTTAELLAKAASWEGRVAIEPRLYEASVADVLEVLSGLARDSSECVLIVGHEPTSSALVQHLTGATVDFPTAALAAIELPIDGWSEIAEARGALRWLVAPKLLRAIGLR